MIYSVLPWVPEAFLALFPFSNLLSLGAYVSATEGRARKSRASLTPPQFHSPDMAIGNLSLHQGNTENCKTLEHGTRRETGRLSLKTLSFTAKPCDSRGLRYHAPPLFTAEKRSAQFFCAYPFAGASELERLQSRPQSACAF